MGNLSTKSQFGPFFIDVRERVLRRDGEPVPLTPKAFDLLAALVDQPGRLISKDELLQQVWPETFVEEANVAYNVFALRKALGDTGENRQYIETVPKRGYRFIATLMPVDLCGQSRLLPFKRILYEEPAPTSSFSARVSPQPEEAPLPLLHDDPAHHDQTMINLKAAIERPLLEPNHPAQSDVPARLSWWSRRAAWATVALLLMGTVYFAVSPWRAPPNPAPPGALPLTSLSGAVRSPSFSPDGRYVVFTWTGAQQDNSDIYVQQIGAGSPLPLTTHPAHDYSPSWSPDGRTIAFLRRKPGAPESELRVIAPLGGSERKVASIQPGRAVYRSHSLSWCPDSQCVLVTDSPGAGQADAVFLVVLNGGEKRQLTYPQGQVVDADPAISPDGRSLVFRRDTTPFSGSFHRMSLSGHMVPEGEPVRLTSTLRAGKPAWLPDSREILFSAGGWLWRLDATRGGTPARLPFFGQDGLTPVVSRTPDGRQRLVYVRSFADANVWRVDTSAAGAPALAPPVVAVASTRFDHIPNLSPDGQRLLFSSDRSGEAEFWVSGLDGSNPLQLTSMAILPGFPRWSPDGELITFHGDPQGRPDVLVVSAGGGTPKTMTAHMPNGGFPSFSRDGRWIYFTVAQTDATRIWKIPAAGGAAVQVTTNAGTLAIESYDGRNLYYVEAPERPSSLWQLPLTGGTAVKLLDGVISGCFDVVEGGIYYIDRASGEAGAQPGGETRLRYFDFATRQSTMVAQNLGAVRFGLTASRDGRMIFYSRVDSSVDELMVVDNFR